jgi:branched-chain amino acid transport system permease protein
LQALLPPDLRVFREAFVFVAVALVLLFRPQGLIPARGLKERI